jgi:DNA-binding MarR family transcriptional regulator
VCFATHICPITRLRNIANAESVKLSNRKHANCFPLHISAEGLPLKYPPMNQNLPSTTGASLKADAVRLADFVLFTQRSCILNLSKELNRGKLSYSQFFLLTYLSSEEYLTMTDVAKKMGHSTAAATGLVDRIEKLGYVERAHASEDRRKIMVRITPKGVEMVAHMRKEIATDLASILSSLDNEAAENVEQIKTAISSRKIA